MKRVASDAKPAGRQLVSAAPPGTAAAETRSPDGVEETAPLASDEVKVLPVDTGLSGTLNENNIVPWSA